MLRPATLLPAVRLSPHVGLSTPRFDGRPLDRRRGPATGLSGDYPGGTCTRWNDAARNDTVVRVHGWSNRFVRTHHGRILARVRSVPPEFEPHTWVTATGNARAQPHGQSQCAHLPTRLFSVDAVLLPCWNSNLSQKEQIQDERVSATGVSTAPREGASTPVRVT